MKRLTLLLAAFFIVSCASQRYIATNNAGSIGPIALIRPLSDMSFIQQDGNLEHNDSLSLESINLLTDAVKASSVRIDTVLQDGLYEDLFSKNVIFDIISLKPKSLSSFEIPDSFLHPLLENNYRYGLYVFCAGFTRDNRNYKKEMKKGIGIALLTTVLSLGTVTAYNFPYKFRNNIAVMIIDAEKSKVVYYNRSTPQESNPMNYKSVSKQINSIIKDFK